MRLFLGEKVHYLPGARRVAGFLLFGLLAGCGGGDGGGDDSAPVQIPIDAINFTAASPTADAPAAQTFTATFGKDVVQLAVVHSGDAIASATSVTNGRTAEITVVPATPSAVGPGAFLGAVAVTGYTCADTTCSRLAAGSTATVTVNYQISPVIKGVAPYVATAGVSDTVLIQGVGFRAFNIDGVRFGDTAATSVAVNTGGTELKVTHPALAAGNYTVHIDAQSHNGPIPSNVVLKVVDPVAYAATTLAHPPTTTGVRRLIYDAERQALITVNDASGRNPIVRYQYANGAWGAPVVAPVGLLDVALSSDGTQLFGISDNSLINVDPVTLAAGTSVVAPSLVTDSALKNIVVGNDNRALITTSFPGSTLTQGYIYDPPTGVLAVNGIGLNNGTPAMSGNGSIALVTQGDPSLTADISVYVYISGTNSLTAGPVSLRQSGMPAVNRFGNRSVLNRTRVYDADLQLLGTLPDTTLAVALKSDGTRAYAYDPSAGGILVYDTSADREEGAYPAFPQVTTLVADPGGGVRMTISPDNGTLFIAGDSRIVVQPTQTM